MTITWPHRSVSLSPVNELLRLFDCEGDFFRAMVKRERERELWIRFTWWKFWASEDGYCDRV